MIASSVGRSFTIGGGNLNIECACEPTPEFGQNTNAPGRLDGQCV